MAGLVGCKPLSDAGKTGSDLSIAIASGPAGGS
jgi:hypothetical protein